MADSYRSIVQTVTAMQYAGGEDSMHEVETFMRPAIVRYIPDGTLICSTQDVTVTVQPTDWIIKNSDDQFSVLTSDYFDETYEKV